jgi:hypothetical protein
MIRILTISLSNGNQRKMRYIISFRLLISIIFTSSHGHCGHCNDVNGNEKGASQIRIRDAILYQGLTCPAGGFAANKGALAKQYTTVCS